MTSSSAGFAGSIGGELLSQSTRETLMHSGWIQLLCRDAIRHSGSAATPNRRDFLTTERAARSTGPPCLLPMNSQPYWLSFPARFHDISSSSVVVALEAGCL